MNTTKQTGWVPDVPSPCDSPWIINPDAFWGHFNNLGGRYVFITWVLGNRSRHLVIRHVVDNIWSFVPEPDRHVYHFHTGKHLAGLPLDLKH